MKILIKVLTFSVFYAVLAILYVFVMGHIIGTYDLFAHGKVPMELRAAAAIFASLTFFISLACYYIKYNRY